MADIPFSIQIMLAFMDDDERQYYESSDRTEQERKRIYTEFEMLWNFIPGSTDAELRMFMRERDWQETEHNREARNLKRVEWKKHRKAEACAAMEKHRGQQPPEQQRREDAKSSVRPSLDNFWKPIEEINKPQAAPPEMSDDLRETLGIPRTAEEKRDAKLLEFMPPQLRGEYDKADVRRKALLWEANERNFEAAREREDQRLRQYAEKSEKAMDMFHRLKEDPSKAHLLPPDDASMDDLHKWHDEMSKPVRIVPFPGEGGYPQAEKQNDEDASGVPVDRANFDSSSVDLSHIVGSKGVIAPADLDADKPETTRLPKQDFPRVALTNEDTTWLTAAYYRLREGRKFEPIEMLVELSSSLPEDFDYNKIDRRLMRFGVELTILGILHIDPATELVEKTDQVIRFVRELIKKSPRIEAITSEQVSEALIIPEEKVAFIFALMSHLGKFWNGGNSHRDKLGYYSVTIRDEKVKREYLRYKSIDDLLERLGRNGSEGDLRERITPTAIVTGNSTDYDVCLSFAGEDRAYVERVAATLRDAGVKPFYDKYEQVSLWGKNLYQHLDEVYRQSAQYCVIFISKSYSDRLWTQHELRSAQARAFDENREYILPVRLDDTKLPGLLPTTGYVSNISPEDLAGLIIKKLQESERTSSTPSSLLEINGSAEPLRLRDGTPATSYQRTAFFQVWTSLVALERAGQALWERVTGEGLAVFADRQRNAQQNIAGQALFFSETDYDALQKIMKAADFYLNGKAKLSDIYDGRVETQGLNLRIPNERDTFMDNEVRAQIQQNKRWLTRYRNLLKDIHARLHARVT